MPSGADESGLEHALAFATHPVPMGRFDPVKRLEHIAVHEAGHAVVALRYGLQIDDVTLGVGSADVGDRGIALGATRFHAPDDDLLKITQVPPEDVAIALLAGFCAEEASLHCHGQKGWAEDVRLARLVLDWTDPMSEGQQKALLTYMNRADEAAVADEEAIRRVATTLQGSAYLPGAEIALLILDEDEWA